MRYRCDKDVRRERTIEGFGIKKVILPHWPWKRNSGLPSRCSASSAGDFGLCIRGVRKYLCHLDVPIRVLGVEGCGAIKREPNNRVGLGFFNTHDLHQLRLHRNPRTTGATHSPRDVTPAASPPAPHSVSISSVPSPPSPLPRTCRSGTACVPHPLTTKIRERTRSLRQSAQTCSPNAAQRRS